MLTWASSYAAVGDDGRSWVGTAGRGPRCHCATPVSHRRSEHRLHHRPRDRRRVPPPLMSARSASASSTTTATATVGLGVAVGLRPGDEPGVRRTGVADAVLGGAGLAADRRAGDRRVRAGAVLDDVPHQLAAAARRSPGSSPGGRLRAPEVATVRAARAWSSAPPGTGDRTWPPLATAAATIAICSGVARRVVLADRGERQLAPGPSSVSKLLRRDREGDPQPAVVEAEAARRVRHAGEPDVHAQLARRPCCRTTAKAYAQRGVVAARRPRWQRGRGAGQEVRVGGAGRRVHIGDHARVQRRRRRHHLERRTRRIGLPDRPVEHRLVADRRSAAPTPRSTARPVAGEHPGVVRRAWRPAPGSARSTARARRPRPCGRRAPRRRPAARPARWW